MTAVLIRRALLPVLTLAAVACGGRFEGGGDLRAQRVVLQREVDGIREVVGRLERGEPMLPLRGSLNLRERPGLEAAVTVIGALEDIRVDGGSSTCGRGSPSTTSGSRKPPVSSRS